MPSATAATLSTHEAIATFQGTKAGAADASDEFDWACFGMDVSDYINYEQLSEFGDEKGTSYSCDIGMQPVEFKDELERLVPGDRVHLAWAHELVPTSVWSPSTMHARRLTLLEKVDETANAPGKPKLCNVVFPHLTTTFR
jgi:hypothetical protein